MAVLRRGLRRTLAALLAAFSLSGTLAGCTVGPDYRPPAGTLSNFHNIKAVADRASSQPAPPLDRWWIGFHDPELSTIITRVLEQNLDIQAALERAAQARAVAGSAGADLLPALDATAQGLAERQSLESPIGALGSTMPGYSRNATLYDAGAGASWEIDLSGGLRRGEEAAQAEARVAEALQLGVRVSVAADAADAYFQVRSSQARLEITAQQIATCSRMLDLTRMQKANGMATESDVAKSEALLAQTQSAVPPLRIALEAQLNRLDVLMGAQPGTYAAELAAPAAIPDIPAMPVENADLLRRRPDVIAAERKLAAANARIGAAVSGYYPELSLSGLLGYESQGPSRLFMATTFQPEAVAGLRWRIFDFGKVDAEVAAADAATREALADYRQTLLHAAEDVENSCMSLVQSEARKKDVTNRIHALATSRDNAQDAFHAGMIPLTDVLVLDRQLLAAEEELPRAQAGTARAAVSLFRSLGGGW